MIVKIGHAFIQVVPFTSHELALTEAPMGMWTPGDLTIRINPGLPPAEQARTLIHELLHAIHHVYEVGDRHDEETLCGKLDTPLSILFADNPNLGDILTRCFIRNQPLPFDEHDDGTPRRTKR